MAFFFTDLAPAEVINISITGKEAIALFKQLLSKSLNCWDSAPARVKTFADIVIEGKPLQDYAVWDKLDNT